MSDNEENGFHGYRYLLDARGSKEYLMRFDNGRPQRGIRVFGQNKELSFVPNQTIFAFDDATTELKASVNGEAVLNVVAYQIIVPSHANPTGEGWKVKYVPNIEYYIEIVSDPRGNGHFRYVMTEESQKLLDENGISKEFPREMDSDSIENITKIARAPGALTSVLRGYPFPPHTLGTAHIARSAQPILDGVQGGLMDRPQQEERKQTQSTQVQRPSGAFKKSSTDPVKYKVGDSHLEQLIKQYCKDLTEQACQGKLDPVVGRLDETDQALKVLTRRKQSSLCFTGEAGVGKTAMFSAIAQRLAEDKDLPESLQDARVLELDLQAMNAGAKFRGQFEEKLKPLIDGLAEREGILKGRKIIMAIDEIHSQLTAGKAEGGSDAGNMMKPFLTSKGISVMGTTTDEEYKKYIEKDGALGRRFEKLRLKPSSEDETIEILRKLWPLVKEHNNLTEDLTNDQFRYIVTMTNRYAPQEAQPSKSEKVINMAAASAEFNHRQRVEKEDITAAIAQMSNLPLNFLNQSDHERFLELERELPNAVLGQPGLQRVTNGLIGSRSGLNDPNQPWGCFVLQGPTGTGKTETCKAIARYLFGTEDALIKLDMSEYAEQHSVARLIGAPPGYVGFDSAEPALTEKVRQRPYCILLLDEIEKAHPNVFNTLLPILNDGKMTDNQGKTVLFNNVIVMMTTNAGAAQVMQKLGGSNGIGFGNGEMDPEKTAEALDKIYSKARELASGGPFRPEMINRIEELGGFITFVPLARPVMDKLVERGVEDISKRLSKPDGANLENVTLELTAEVKAQLAEDGYNPTMGARPLRKVLREKVANPLGKWLMANKAEVLKQAAEKGALKLVIRSIENFAPEIVSANEPVLANDNVAVAAAPVPPAKKPSGKKTIGF